MALDSTFCKFEQGFSARVAKQASSLFLLFAIATVPALASGLGNVTAATVSGDTLTLSIGTDTMLLKALTPSLLRVDYQPGGLSSSRTLVLDPNATWGTGNTLSIKTSSDPLVIQTKAMTVQISRSPCRISVFNASGTRLLQEPPGGGVYSTGVNFTHSPGDNFYGISSYQLNDPAATGMLRNTGGLVHALRQGYAGAPFIFTPAYGLLVDSDGGNIAITPSTLSYSGVSRTDVEYFVFVGGPTQILKNLALLSGSPPMYPKWALGFMDCERGDTETKVTNNVQTYRSLGIPLDMMVMDVDWKAWGEDNYGEWRWNSAGGSGGISPDEFPDGASGAFATSMTALGVKLGGIMKPRVILQNLDGSTTIQAQDAIAHGYLVASEQPFRDYLTNRSTQDLDFSNASVRSWYWSHAQAAYDSGVVAWWNDEADDLNNFQFLNMARTMYEGQRGHTANRVWSINRNFYLGSQRYAYGLWSGDIATGFPSMATQPAKMLSAINNGEVKWGMDIGGYTGRATSENYVRWMQFGAFTPIFRMHCDASGSSQPQPWNFGSQAEALAKSTIQLRYKLIPYIYSYERQSYETGLGIVQPLFYNFNNDPNVINDTDAWMFGDYLLVAPVMAQGQTSKNIYLPAGTWYDYFKGTSYRGAQLINYPLNATTWEDIPLFVRKGAIIPSQPVLNYVGEKDITAVTLDVFPDLIPSSFTYYDDDGTTYAYEGGAYFKQAMTALDNGTSSSLTIGGATGSFVPPLQNYLCALHGRGATAVLVNGVPVTPYSNLTDLQGSTGAGWATGTDVYGDVTYVKVPAGLAQNIVTCGSNPAPPTGQYEAEKAILSRGAVVQNTHTGYSGFGYVAGYQYPGASTSFTVFAPQTGNYNVALAYANGQGVTETLSIYLNGTKVQQTSLVATSNWNTWGTQTETLPLNAGTNTIAYVFDPGDGAHVNLDYISATPVLAPAITYQAEDAALSGGAVVQNTHTGYTGTGFVAGFQYPGASATVTVNVAQAGDYQVELVYANGSGQSQTLGLYVNGVKTLQTVLAPLANWNTWAVQPEILALQAGSNTLTYKYDSGDSGHVNLDNITVAPFVAPAVTYEAEAATLGGGTSVQANHLGYSGVGYVGGFQSPGASTTFTVTAPHAGSYAVAVIYGNGAGKSETLSLYVNGVKIRQTSLATLANWTTWSTQMETVTLNVGTNTLTLKFDPGDTGNVNLDYIAVLPQ